NKEGVCRNNFSFFAPSSNFAFFFSARLSFCFLKKPTLLSFSFLVVVTIGVTSSKFSTLFFSFTCSANHLSSFQFLHTFNNNFIFKFMVINRMVSRPISFKQKE